MLCNVLLRPQTYNEVRSNEHIVTCDSCGRILFYDPANEAAAPPTRSRREKGVTKPENDPESVMTGAPPGPTPN